MLGGIPINGLDRLGSVSELVHYQTNPYASPHTKVTSYGAPGGLVAEQSWKRVCTEVHTHPRGLAARRTGG